MAVTRERWVGGRGDGGDNGTRREGRGRQGITAEEGEVGAARER